MKNQEQKQATKREQLKRINGLIKELQNESTKRMAQDLETLNKPYYYKGRFNSLSNKVEKEKIKEYYKQEKEETKKYIIAVNKPIKKSDLEIIENEGE